jgi:3-deoxy-D-manno-octulosonic-acid transferase
MRLRAPDPHRRGGRRMKAAFWLALYRGAWRLALPPLGPMARAGILPRNWRVTERLEPAPPPAAGGRPLWLHCASLGEAKGLWALARALPPDAPLLLTAATAAGADYLARRCAAGGSRRARLAPLDHPGLIDAFLERGGIRGLCLYEAELWPNALEACARRGLPAVLVAGRLTPEASGRYRRFGGAALGLLARLAWIEAQSGGDRARFEAAIGAPVFAGGDPKALAFLPEALPRPGPRSGFAFVSLHLPELRRLLPILPVLQDRHDLIVFPRRPGEMEAFAAALEPLGFARASRRPAARHLLVDGFGQVMARLPHCHTAFVGGSLVRRGCHNLWEPLAAGCRILFGPDYRLQRALAETLMAHGLARVIADPRELGALPPPPAGHAEACAALAAALREGLERSLAACRERIIATFFADAPAPTAGRQAGPAVPAGGGKQR